MGVVTSYNCGAAPREYQSLQPSTYPVRDLGPFEFSTTGKEFPGNAKESTIAGWSLFLHKMSQAFK